MTAAHPSSLYTQQSAHRAYTAFKVSVHAVQYISKKAKVASPITWEYTSVQNTTVKQWFGYDAGMFGSSDSFFFPL